MYDTRSIRGDAEEEEQDPGAEREEARRRGHAVGEDPVGKQQDAEQERRGGDERRPACEAPARQLGALTDGGDRRHSRRAARRTQARDQRDDRPDDEADDDRARFEHRSGGRQVDPEQHEHRLEPLRERKPQEEPGHRAKDPDHECLDDHRFQDLAPSRAERAERRKLARPLGDRDRQRVRDHEAAHEERDAGEREQEIPDEAREPVDALLVLLDLSRGVAHLSRGGQDRLDLGDQLRRRYARLRLHADQVELSHAAQECLERRQVEHGEGRTADRDAGQLHDPGDPEPLDGAVPLDADRVADLVVLARSDVRVDRDLVRAVWPVARRELERVEALIAGRVDAEGEARRAVGRDHLAGAADELRLVVGDGSLDRVHVWQRPDPREQVVREARRLHAVPVVVREGRLGADDRVGVLVRLREDRRERVVDRVREDVGAADHRDAEDDRDRRQKRTELPPGEALQCDAKH